MDKALIPLLITIVRQTAALIHLTRQCISFSVVIPDVSKEGMRPSDLITYKPLLDGELPIHSFENSGCLTVPCFSNPDVSEHKAPISFNCILDEITFGSNACIISRTACHRDTSFTSKHTQ